MRYPASEKLEITRTVEPSPLPVPRTLAQIGIPKSTFYNWLDRPAAGGLEDPGDRKPPPRRVWNGIGEEMHRKAIALALDEAELSPSELVISFTVVSAARSPKPFYRTLKAEGLLTTLPSSA
jgi:putative transposase